MVAGGKVTPRIMFSGFLIKHSLTAYFLPSLPSEVKGNEFQAVLMTDFIIWGWNKKTEYSLKYDYNGSLPTGYGYN